MIKRSIALAVLAFSLSFAAAIGSAQTKAVDAEGHAWWQHAVFYEVYPRSFADSDNNGIGDLKGITSKLDYLQQLGVNAIWITPCFPSPKVDFGYDVSDYEAIDPMYGTMADFDKLVAEGKKRGIRVILDFVVNHTSDQHKWFINSRSSRTAEKRDWYIWREGKGPGQPPNNWLSIFGTGAWTLDPKTDQYYYHYFYPQQPDLNWRNPAVEKAMLDVTRFWYKRGVAGFRLDAVDTLYEDPKLTDDPLVAGTDKFGRPNLDEKYNKKLPEVHDAMKKLRSVADDYGAVLIGETWTTNVDQLRDYYGAKNDELQMPMDLMMTGFKGLSADEYRKHIAAVNAAGHWPTWVITNHDIVRSYTRYGDGKHNDDIAKMMAALYLTLRGSVIMYYGEEIGMENNDPKRWEDVQDPEGKIGWPNEIGRDGERTPMQWTEGVNAGFSTTKPWLPVPASAKTHNVVSELKEPGSVLNIYKKLIALRHTEAALRDGDFTSLDDDDPHVLMYLRQYQGETILVAINMSDVPQQKILSRRITGFGPMGPKLDILLTSFHEKPISDGMELTLEPYSAFIAKLSK